MRNPRRRPEGKKTERPVKDASTQTADSLRATAARGAPQDSSGPTTGERSISAMRGRQHAENVLRPTRPRERRQVPPGPSAAHTIHKASSEGRGADHRRRASAAETIAPESSATTMPEQVRTRFVQVGRDYHFPDGGRAFTDRGNRLTTSSENTEVVRSLVAIAQARGWSDITVSGTERFRRDAWFAASLAGLTVRGYRASAFERERLAREMRRREDSGQRTASAAAERAGEPGKQPGRAHRRGGLIAGRLIDHGAAPYRHDPHEPMSYFVRLETERGERTVWGVDLQRAFKESLTKPGVGEEVGLRAVRSEAVTVKAHARGEEGKVIERELATHRHRWILEKRAFFETREAAASQLRNPSVTARQAVGVHPELAGTYLYLRGAEEIARRRIRDPEDQRRFVEIVRDALADSVARGEPLPAVRLRERETDRSEHARGRAALEPARAAQRGQTPERS